MQIAKSLILKFKSLNSVSHVILRLFNSHETEWVLTQIIYKQIFPVFNDT